MAEITRLQHGYFAGRSLVQQSGKRGGARHVFYKIDDIKDDLVFPPLGGQVKNPFPRAAKFYAGDLMEYRVDKKAELPEIYLLKTYEVHSVSGTTVNIVRSGYRHLPCIGDKLGIAPDVIGGAMTAKTITAVKETFAADNTAVWACTFDAALTGAKAGDILTEADADDEMVIKRVNAVAGWDYDFMWSEAADPSDLEFEKARYFLTPSLRGTMYIFRMSPIPQCVLDLNISNIEGVFRVDAFNKPVVLPKTATD